MRPALTLGGFALALLAVFGGALAAGAGVGPVGLGPDSGAHGEHGTDHDTGHDTGQAEASSTEAAGGLAVAEAGYVLDLARPELTAGPSTRLDFTVRGPDGAPVTAYDDSHTKPLHLIAVRRDMTGFQHVHPRLAAGGAWSVPLDLRRAGQWRVFADFVPTGGEPLTLGADLAVEGRYRAAPLPAPSRTGRVAGYSVRLDGGLVPGESAELTLSVSRDGRPVTDLDPYLGAYGHLVALRAGDLAYLHVHPDGEPGDGQTPPGPDVTFHATAPSVGDYRLFLDFRHRGVVRTAELTVRAGDDGTSDERGGTGDPTSAEGSHEHAH